MDKLYLEMYPPEEEWDEDEEGEWDEDEDEGDDWDEEGDWDEDEDWDEEDWDEEDEGEEEEEVDGVVKQQPQVGVGGALPEGWVETGDEAGNIYYYNEVTGESSWDWPSGESSAGNYQQEHQGVGGVGGGGKDVSGWQTLQDDVGNWYHFNPMTGESRWA